MINLVNDSVKLFLPLPKNFKNSIDEEISSSGVVIKPVSSQEQDGAPTNKHAEENLTPLRNPNSQTSGYIKYPAYDFF